MPYKDLRHYLNVLEQHGKLCRVRKEVDKDWELACIARWVFQSLLEHERYGLRFEKVKGFDVPVVLGVLGASREVYALALETTPDKIYEKWSHALSHLIPPFPVKEAPVKEVVKKGKDVNLFDIPVPVFTPGRDDGAYVSCSSVITKDPDTGIQNAGNYRQRVIARDRLGVLIAPTQHIGMHYFHKYQPRNEPMPIAVSIGNDPALALTSVAKVPYGVDEFDVAGGFRGEPIPVVPAETVDLMVPANSEYIIEGHVMPHVREKEGQFGEFTGYMGIESDRTFIQVECVTHRKDPMYHGFLSQIPPSESSLVRSQAFAANLYKHLIYDLKEPAVKDVHFTEAGGSEMVLIIQVKPMYPGHARKIGLMAANILASSLGKLVYIVDDDIDIRDPFSVEWALSFRVDPVRDVEILHHSFFHILDPAVPQTENIQTVAPGSKIIVDATMKGPYPEISLPPKRYMMRVYECWGETGLPQLKMTERTRLLLDKHDEGLVYQPFQSFTGSGTSG
ncbi:MAG: UbiD family decarboxylase [Candidatus Binatia bacterium]